MKSIAYLFLISIFIDSSLYAQDSVNFSQDSLSYSRTPLYGNDELRINGFYLLALYFELSYERILSQKTAAGITAGVFLPEAPNLAYTIIPYYRFYLGKTRATGFFIDGSSVLIFQESYEINNNKNVVGLAPMLAIGGKFYTKDGWIGELLLGGGPFINGQFRGEGFPRFGVLIGKRF